ncbi:hypothetical protein B0H16DRAFT_433258 [Mycena metata]|uniref:Uncharacterized protein n=1 Tax=Mycena metata TaxID=1033252 RepID=A0AAD7MIP2_9AGAR|nr:hypothetical protein B0H16DRAFT_433258 [Mycena metata]
MRPSPLAVIMSIVVLETFLYAIFLACACTTLYLRIARHRATRESASIWRSKRLWWNPIVIPTLAILATCSAHWILTVDRFFESFLGSTDIAEGLEEWFDDSQATQIARISLAEITLLVGDAVIIHRLWLIWHRKMSVIILPIILWLGVLVCGIVVSFLVAHSDAENNRFLTSSGRWATGNWILTALTNIYCTALITWEIWGTSRVVQALGDGMLMHVLAILVESAALSTAWSIFFAVSFQTGSNLQFLATDLTPSIVGLVNIFIYLRVGFGWSYTQKPTMDASAAAGATTDVFALSMPTTDSYHLASISFSPPTAGK